MSLRNKVAIVGVGVMGRTLARRVRSITKIVAVRCRLDDYPATVTYPERCEVVRVDDPPPRGGPAPSFPQSRCTAPDGPR